MAPPERERVLALAAVFQALAEVRGLAEQGRNDPDRSRTCLSGLLGHYNASVLSLYGGPDRLDDGLRELIDHLGQPKAMQLTRYLIGVMQLERRLRRSADRLERVAAGLGRAREQADYFGDIGHESVIHGLADLYSEQISPLRPRIIVQGHAAYLQDPRTAALIRSLLLAAIRAAGLWQLNGGGRLRLVLGRRGVIDTARAALTQT